MCFVIMCVTLPVTYLLHTNFISDVKVSAGFPSDRFV